MNYLNKLPGDLLFAQITLYNRTQCCDSVLPLKAAAVISEGTLCSHSLNVFHRRHRSAPGANRMSLNAKEIHKDRPRHLSHLRETSQLHHRPHYVGGKHQLQIRRQRVNTRLSYQSMSQISSQTAPDGETRYGSIEAYSL